MTFLPSVISSFFNQNKGGPGPHSLDAPLHKHSMITLLKLASPVKAVWFFRLCQNFFFFNARISPALKTSESWPVRAQV